MASNRQEETHNLLFEPKVPHFFKVILSETLKSGKLVIPKLFVKRYGKDLTNQVVLKVPTGKVWPVEITKCNGNVCLNLGWQEFVKFYSVDIGHFLVFKYERSSIFSVIIFDNTATEIDYRATNIEDNGQDPEKSREDASVKRLNERMKEARDLRPNKRRKTGATTGRNEILRTAVEEHCSKPFFGGADNAAKDGGDISKTKGKLKSSDGVIEKTQDCPSVNPSFTVTVCHTALISNGYLSVPSSFTKMYLKKSSSFILKVSDGRAWTVECIVREMGNGQLRAKLISGWAKFVREIDLRIGDCCLFELLKIPKMSMKVTIIRDSEDGTKGHNPFFHLVMKPSYVGVAPKVWVPTSFAKQYLTGAEDVVLVIQDGKTWRTWNVKCYGHEPREAMFFTSGFKAFVEDNNVKVGDVCIFKLITGSRFSLKVRIFRIHEGKSGSSMAGQFTAEESQRDPQCHSSINIEKKAGHVDSCVRDNGVNKTGGDISDDKASIKRSAYESGSSSFLIVMTPSYVGVNFIMNVPLVFLRRHFNQKPSSVSLQVSDGRVWPVKCTICISNGKGAAKFTTGWKTFVVDNDLKVGDACEFELIDSVKNILNVIIFRAVKSS